MHSALMSLHVALFYGSAATTAVAASSTCATTMFHIIVWDFHMTGQAGVRKNVEGLLVKQP